MAGLLRRDKSTTSGKAGKGSTAIAGKGAAKAGAKTAAKPKAPKVSRRERAKQFGQVFALTRRNDPRLVPYVAIAFLVPFVLLLSLGLVIGQAFTLGLFGFTLGVFAALLIFGRRAQAMQFTSIEGQAGAAAAVLQRMRGDWRVTPAVGFTREQDMVHRVVGRPGVILVAEGSGGRTRNLIATEKKRVARVIGDTPVYDVIVGDEEGQVSLRQLERHFVKLPRNIKPKQVNVLDQRLKALGAAQQLPIPKGPLPKGGRMPRGKMR